MQHTLVAVFDNRGDAQKAMDDLLASGFTAQSVRLGEGGATADAGAAATATGATATTATTGAAAPEEGIGTSIKHFFSDIFGSGESTHAQKYSAAVTHGHYVLTLTAPSEPEVERAADIVERYGPVDIDEQAAQWSGAAMAGQAGVSTAGAAMQGGQPGSSMQGAQASVQRTRTDTTAIPVVEEQLKVGKRAVDRGGIRVFRRVVETPVSESVDLREEHVSVERHAVDQPIDPSEIEAFKETSFEVRESAEEAVVEKTARVVEEVVVGKDVTQRQEHISDTVRHTEVEVEQLAGSPRAAHPGSLDDDSYFRSHWTSTYASAGGTYDEYAPAYRYGSSMAGSDQYRGRPWTEVEPTLRSDWEARNPGSAWDNFKAAIRHGWDRITS